jgi:hypothetical protein
VVLESILRLVTRPGSLPADHSVQFFADDETLLDTLANFVSTGLAGGESVIVLATAEHLRFLGNRLVRSGFDLVNPMSNDRFITMNAQTALSACMEGERLDEKLFSLMIGRFLHRAQARSARVRVYGELVAPLCQQGYSTAMLRLEELWDKLCKTHSFTLLCGYPENGLSERDRSAIDAIHALHSHAV